MIRTIFAATLGLAAFGSASAYAADLTSAQKEELRPQAEKSCKDALDQDRLDYDTIDDCVDATIQKLARARAQHAQAATDGNRASR